MKPQRVIVKDVTGSYSIKVAVHATDHTVFVTSENEFERIEKGTSDLFPIGFSRQDVFAYDGQPIDQELTPKRLRLWGS